MDRPAIAAGDALTVSVDDVTDLPSDPAIAPTTSSDVVDPYDLGDPPTELFQGWDTRSTHSAIIPHLGVRNRRSRDTAESETWLVCSGFLPLWCAHGRNGRERAATLPTCSRPRQARSRSHRRRPVPSSRRKPWTVAPNSKAAANLDLDGMACAAFAAGFPQAFTVSLSEPDLNPYGPDLRKTSRF